MVTSFANANARRISLFALLLLIAGLLSACGGTENTAANDNNFVLPIYQGMNEIQALSNDTNFTSKILPTDKDFVERKVRVFTTTAGLGEVKTFYNQQLGTLGWTDRTSSVVGLNTISNNDGWIQAFEKPAGNNTGRSRGLMMFSPTFKNDLLQTYRDNGALPSGQNVLVVVDGLYTPGGTPSAPTATPKP